jgi:pyridoxal phosphate enzyme (YggS family)
VIDPAAPADVARLRAAHEAIHCRIQAACLRSGRDPAGVELVAVSKTVPPEVLRAALASGLAVLGENRVQEALEKVSAVPGARWHMIGQLQSNKAGRALELFDEVESVDSLRLAQRLNQLVDTRLAHRRPVLCAPGPLPVYLQVNVDADPAKAGFTVEEVERELPELAALPHLELRGLMTVGLLSEAPELSRPTFVRLRELSARLRPVEPRLGPGLSMGMTDDFAIAVEEGSTLLRIGRAIFGERRTT